MPAEAQDEHHRTHRVFGRPSSTLGRVAVGALAAAIAFVFVVNATAEQGSADDSGGRGIIFVAMIGCLLASWVTGLVAVFRNHERSWAVLLPTALISLVVANELLQGLLLLAGAGD